MKDIEIEVPEGILKIKEIFKSHGHELFIVGGAVRDALLGKIPKDLDIATDAVPEKILSMLKGHFITKEVGKAFGVIIAMVDDEDVEIATFRTDLESSDGRRPDEVIFTTIEEDVKRRDLTINALFYNIETKEIVDFVGGVQDMKDGIIRTVGDADRRFEEDRLRVLRAIRFSSRLGFEMTDEIFESIISNNSLEQVSGQRIRGEFLNALKGAKSREKLFHTINGFKLFDWIFPNLKVGVFENENCHIDIVLANSLKGNSVSDVRKNLHEANYNGDEINRISYLIDFLSLSVNSAYYLKKKFDNSNLLTSELIEFAVMNNMDYNLVKTFTEYSPSTNGNDLKDQGFAGKGIGDEMIRRETQNFFYMTKGVH